MSNNYLNLNTDTTLGGKNASDYEVASQKSTKTYVDEQTKVCKNLFCVADGNKTAQGKPDLLSSNANLNSQATITTAQGIFGTTDGYDYTENTSHVYTYDSPIQCSFINSFSNSTITFKMDFQDGDTNKRIHPHIILHYSDGRDVYFDGSPFEREQTIELGWLCGKYIASLEIEVNLIDTETRTEGTCGIGQVQLYTQVASGTEVTVNTGGAFAPLKCVSASGEIYEITTSSSALSISSLADGDYYLMMTKTNTPYIIAYDSVYRQQGQPESGIWVDTSSTVNKAVKYENEQWVETTDVPIAIIKVENGLLTWIRNLPFGNAFALGMFSDFAPLQIVEQWQSSNDPWGYTLYANNFYEMHGTCWVNAQWAGSANSGHIGLWKPLYLPSCRCSCSLMGFHSGVTFTPQIEIHEDANDNIATSALVSLNGTPSVSETWVPVSFQITGYLYYRER